MTLVPIVSKALDVGDWRNVVLMGTSIPSMLGCVKEGTVGEIERREWTTWTEICKLGLSRRPAFGDYAVPEPDPSERCHGWGWHRPGEYPLHHDGVNGRRPRTRAMEPGWPRAVRWTVPKALGPQGVFWRDTWATGSLMAAHEVTSSREVNACGEERGRLTTFFGTSLIRWHRRARADGTCGMVSERQRCPDAAARWRTIPR